MDDVQLHLSTARHFCYELRLPADAENFHQQFGAREVCRASNNKRKVRLPIRDKISRRIWNRTVLFSARPPHAQLLFVLRNRYVRVANV